MHRLIAVVPLVALFASATGCGRRARAAELDDSSSPQGGRHALTHDGARRSFVLRVPARAAGDTTRLPVVLMLHGGGGNAANAEQMSGLTALGQRERFLVVYPEGSSRFRTALLTWNAGHCCGYAMERRVDDVGFISALLDTLIARHHADPARVYVTGMSNGAMMSHRLGIALAPRIAAIAPVVGALFGDEAPPRTPVSALIINGALDRSVPLNGGEPGGPFSSSWDGTHPVPATEQGEFWARANGCEPGPDVRNEGAVTVRRYRCPAGRGVEMHIVHDGGHSWPGGQAGSRRGDVPSASMRASEAMWAFFKAHTRVTPPPDP